MAGQANESLVKQYKISYISEMTQVTTERLLEISKLIEAKVLKIRIAKIFPFDETPKALEYLKTGHPEGKIVISVSP